MSLLNFQFFSGIFLTALSACSGQSEPPLFFREDWKEIAAATPVNQGHVSTQDLVLSLYGPAKNEIKKSHHPEIANDPFYIWSGDCKSNWAVTLRHRSRMVDLTGGAKIKWKARQSGFRELRVIIKLNDGAWLVSDRSHDYSDEWSEKEFFIADIKWRKLNIEPVTEGIWVPDPDLKRVIEIGFTDLMTGGGTPASSRLDWIAVYGKPIETQK